MGKNYKFLLPGPTTEIRGKLQKKIQRLYFRSNFTPFGGNFPLFRGSDREFCNFSPSFGNFRPGGFPGPLRGKTTRNGWLLYQSLFLGRGCDEALFSEKMGFSVKRAEAIQ